MAEIEDDDWGLEPEKEETEETPQDINQEETEETEAEDTKEAEGEEQNNEQTDGETSEESKAEGEEKEGEVSEADKEAYELLKKYNPEGEFSKEGAYQKMQEEYEALHEKVSRSEADARAIADVLESDPQFADVMEAVADGVPFSVAIATYLDLDNIKPMEGDDDYEKYVAAKEKRQEELKERQKFSEQLVVNQKETEKVSREFFEEEGMDDEAQSKFVDFVDGILKGISEGTITKDNLKRLHKAFTYDSDVKEARRAGEVAGRNQRIEQKRESREKGSDGLPSAGVSVAPENKTSKKGGPMAWLEEEEPNGGYYN